MQTAASCWFSGLSRGRLLVLLWLAMAAGGLAQIGTPGAFVGTVRDSSGAVLPGATVRAINIATGATQQAVADEAGNYRISLLPPGQYRLEASLQGFRTEVRPQIELTVARTQQLDFTLTVGSVTEEVTVSAAAPLVDTQSSSASGLVSGEQIRDLPLNGRSFDQLITLSPGTVMFSQRTVNAFQGEASQYSAGGTRPNTSRLVMDGTELSGAGGNHTQVSTASGKLLGVEGIQEFVVVTNNGDASFGKKPGGQVNIVTRSGTNHFHGSVFEFLRNDIFDARQFFDAAKSPLRENNYGFAAGGPVVHDKTFFFANLEEYKERRGRTLVAPVPTLAVRRGIFPNGTVVQVHSNMVPILNLYPVPNGKDFGDGTANAITPARLAVNDHYFVTRLDHQFSASSSIFGRYVIQTGERSDPNDNGLGQFLETDPFRTQLLTLGYKKLLSPRLVNQASVAFNRAFLHIVFVPRPGVTVPPEMILVPGETGQGAIVVASGQVPNLGANTTGGTAKRIVARNVFEYSDKLSYSRGSHYFDLGGELHRIQSNEFAGTMPRGTLTFPSLPALVQGKPSQLNAPLPGSDGFKGWRQIYAGLYVQDSYKIRRTLTLNLGLRWEFMSNPLDVKGRTSAFVPFGGQLTGIYPNGPTVTPRALAVNPSGNWAPRVGFAWDVFGDARTSLRGGVGLFYAQMENEFRRALGPSPPFWNSVTVPNPPFPNPGQALATATLGRLSPIGIQQAPDIPTVAQYNLRLERSLRPGTLLAVAYLGAHGYHLGRSGSPQTPPPFLNANGRLQFPQVLQNPNLSNSGTYYVWDANSFYNALEVELEKRLSHGLRFKTAYTWSRSLDDGQDLISNLIGQSGGTPVMADHRSARGLSPFHVGRRLVANWTYDLPWKAPRGPSRVVLGGWQLSGIFQAQDGFPFTVYDGISQSFSPNPTGGTSDRPDLVAGRNNNPVLGGPNRYFDPAAFQLQPKGVLGNLGNNTLIGPGLVTVDLSLSKNFPIREAWGVQFRADAFNLPNRANFGLPNNLLSTFFQSNGQNPGAAGQITTTATPGREFQFSLKIHF